MNPNPTLSDILTQLADLNTNLSLLTATLQDFRWWLKEKMEKQRPGDGRLEFWEQYQPQSSPMT